VEANGDTQGENVLTLFGFTTADGEPYGFEWVW
jgi:hypothetical protein